MLASDGPETFCRTIGHKKCPARAGKREKEMRSLIRSIGIVVGILTFAGVQNASAQITDAVDFTTSFPFTVGNTMVQAGNYTIRPDDDNPQILELTGKNGSVLFQVDLTQARETPSKTELVFSRFGNSYVLKDIWVEGSDTGVETMPVEGERHAAKASGAKSEQRIAARRKSATAAGR
jgi:hypothetical protein